jgi:signal transduction histidine kinase
VTTGALVEGIGDVVLQDNPTSSVGALLRLLYDMLFGLSWGLLTTYAVLLFPDGRLPSPRWRWVAGAAAAQIVLMLVAFAVAAGPVGDRGPDNPLGVAALGAVPLAVGTGVSLTLTLTGLISLASLVVRWRSADGVERRRLAWLALAAVIVFVCVAAGSVSSALGAPEAVGVAAEAVAIAVLPLSVAVAVLRHNLFDVEVVLDRTVVYVLLSGLVVLTYAGCLALASRMLGDAAGQGASLLATAVVAVSLSPLKHRLDTAVDRLLFGERSRPYDVLSALATRLQSPEREAVADVTETVRQALRLPFAAVLRPGEHDAAPPGRVERVDLVAHGRSEGTLLVGLRRGQDRFSPTERALLGDVARQLAAALRSGRLAADLQASRERLVRAREDERLRVRRDLHDGVGPVLAAIGLRVDALQGRAADADETTRSLLAKVREEVQQCVVDVRRVIEGLRPPALDQLGLAGVVREHATALSAAGLEVTVDVPGRLQINSAAVEVAAYRIATEAMTNVARHASARRCAVRICPEGGNLVVEVLDDGTGVPPDRRDGVGLASMRERAAELGGALAVSPASGGGTMVTATLPLPEAAP